MKKRNPDKQVIIVGAGLAGLACACRLMKNDIPFLILEADQRIGGRLKTDILDGFTLNHGFQVLQTAYPEAKRVLDYDRLALKPFAPGAIIRIKGKFYRVADPRRRPSDLWGTLNAPIGSLGDRFRIIKLARNLRKSTVGELFSMPDMPTIDFLNSLGFSNQIIRRFFKPFFAGVCLDPEIRASSRVFRYVYRVFDTGDVALPSQGMGDIATQLAENLPKDRIRTGNRVLSLTEQEVLLTSGERVEGCAVVLATEGPETARLLGAPEPVGSRGELCLYFTAKEPPITEPYMILNGDGTGWVNSLTVPSLVAPSYAPAGQALISVVVIGHLSSDNPTVEATVREELTAWFGKRVGDWRHLKTYRIEHALPEQQPPMPDPSTPSSAKKNGVYICGEYGSVPGIQWALLSGRLAAERVLEDLCTNG